MGTEDGGVRLGVIIEFNSGLQTLLQSGVTNYLIVALDKEVRDHLEGKGMNVYYHKVGTSPVLQQEFKI